MKIKNITNSIRELRNFGKVIEFKPNEIKELEKPIYDENAFEIVKDNIQKSKRKVKKSNNYKEVIKDDTSN